MAIFPDPTNMTNMTDVLSYLNIVTMGWFGLVMLIVIFVVGLLSLKIYSTHKAVAASSFLTTIVAIFFKILNLISTQVLVGSIVLLIVAIIWLFVAESREF